VVTSHKRTRNGIKHDVREHFAHNPGSACRGESVEHLAAKDALVKHAHRWKFMIRCNSCTTVKDIDVGGPNFVTERPWSGFFLDVGVECTDGVVVGAIEVLKTHPVGPEKAAALTAGGLAWCEVRASDVLALVAGSLHSLEATQAAPYTCLRCTDTIAAEQETRARAKINGVLHTIRSTAAETSRRHSYTRVIEEELGVLAARLTPDQISRVRSLVKLGPNGIPPPDFDGSTLDYDTITAITGVSTNADSEKLAHDKWQRIVTVLTVYATDNPDAYAAQKLNTDIVAAVRSLRPDLSLAEQSDIEDAGASQPREVLAFGKYKGMTFEQVEEHDMAYIRWLAMWSGRRADKRPEQRLHEHGTFKARARLALQGVCLLCFDLTESDWKNWCTGCYRDAETTHND
jgi:hypothetical protein